MFRYDPFLPPDRAEWFELTEDERVRAVNAFHGLANDVTDDRAVHALLHVIVENQIATPERAVVRTLDRLMSEGIGRHEAIHAIASILLGHIGVLLGDTPTTDMRAAYTAALDKFTVQDWYEGDTAADDGLSAGELSELEELLSGNPASSYRPGEPARNPYRSIGRNDPCPCGSGRKFKKCCQRP